MCCLNLSGISYISIYQLRYCTFSALHSTALYNIALHCITLNWTTLHYIALNCTVLNCTELHCTALNCTVLNCTALRCPEWDSGTDFELNIVKRVAPFWSAIFSTIPLDLLGAIFFRSKKKRKTKKVFFSIEPFCCTYLPLWQESPPKKTI